jgi:RNA polymerase sigma-70 factor, ECF subfamily
VAARAEALPGPALIRAVDREHGDADASARVEEAALVERVRAGDAAAFDTLVVRYMPRAFGLAFRLLGQREDAEDLVQDAFLAALERIDSFEAGRPFGPWFFRILVNRGLNARKARSIRQMEEIPATAQSSDDSPYRAAERRELRERLGAALAQLPEKQQTIVRLFELEGFSGAEIAEMLELSPGTVRWHIHQARKALRDALEPLAGIE